LQVVSQRLRAAFFDKRHDICSYDKALPTTAAFFDARREYRTGALIAVGGIQLYILSPAWWRNASRHIICPDLPLHAFSRSLMVADFLHAVERRWCIQGSGVVEGDAGGWYPQIFWKGMASPK
jgi:hypothetical protein